jgi:hypothetical protein
MTKPDADIDAVVRDVSKVTTKERMLELWRLHT